MSNDSSDEACYETGKNLSKNQRDIVDARLHWADAVNRLEPNWEVIDDNEECTAEAECKQRPK